MDDVLAKIEDLASLFFTIEDIALMCELDESTLRREVRGKRTDKAKAYYKGKYSTMLAMRRQMVDFAKAGSPQAETLLVENLERQESNE